MSTMTIRTMFQIFGCIRGAVSDLDDSVASAEMSVLIGVVGHQFDADMIAGFALMMQYYATLDMAKNSHSFGAAAIKLGAGEMSVHSSDLLHWHCAY